MPATIDGEYKRSPQSKLKDFETWIKELLNGGGPSFTSYSEVVLLKSRFYAR